MGSYNSSCAVSGLPITSNSPENVLLLLYTKDRNSYNEFNQFLGTPVAAKYFDYGDYVLQDENPFESQLAPDFEAMTGIALLDKENKDNYFSAQTRRGINLWEAPNEFLHLYHELILYRPKWALSKVNEKYSLNITSVLDWEGSKSSSKALKTDHPQAWDYYIELLKDCPCSYEERASLVHKWLRDDDMDIAKNTCKKLVEAEQSVYAEYITQTFMEGIPNALTFVEKAFADRIVISIKTACVYQSAFELMAACTRSQIGEEGCKNLFETLKRFEQDEDYAQALEKLESAKETNNLEKMNYAKMLLAMNRGHLGKDKKFKLGSLFAGNKINRKYLEPSKYMVLFAENFYHGFEFSSMTSNRQYEGISHIVAQAQATLEIAENLSKVLYKQGNWETYQYHR